MCANVIDECEEPGPAADTRVPTADAGMVSERIYGETKNGRAGMPSGPVRRCSTNAGAVVLDDDEPRSVPEDGAVRL